MAIASDGDLQDGLPPDSVVQRQRALLKVCN
jgi:hypothetical protein